MDDDLWFLKMRLLSRREPMPEGECSPFPFSTGDFNSSGEKSKDVLITRLLVADALRGKFSILDPGGCCSYRGVKKGKGLIRPSYKTQQNRTFGLLLLQINHRWIIEKCSFFIFTS